MNKIFTSVLVLAISLFSFSAHSQTVSQEESDSLYWAYPGTTWILLLFWTSFRNHRPLRNLKNP